MGAFDKEIAWVEKERETLRADLAELKGGDLTLQEKRGNGVWNDTLNMSARKFAEHIRVPPPNAVTAILNGGRGITAQMALRLGRAFGAGPGYWMRLQNIYEEKRARSELAGELEQIAGLL